MLPAKSENGQEKVLPIPMPLEEMSVVKRFFFFFPLVANILRLDAELEFRKGS